MYATVPSTVKCTMKVMKTQVGMLVTKSMIVSMGAMALLPRAKKDSDQRVPGKRREPMTDEAEHLPLAAMSQLNRNCRR
jgi:hypothetical protein